MHDPECSMAAERTAYRQHAATRHEGPLQTCKTVHWFKYIYVCFVSAATVRIIDTPTDSSLSLLLSPIPLLLAVPYVLLLPPISAPALSSFSRDSSSFRNCPTIVAFPACSCPILCGQLAIFRFLKSRGLVNCITRLKFPLRGLMLQIILKPPAVRGHPALLSAFLQILGIYRQHCYRQGLLTEALPKKASRTLFS